MATYWENSCSFGLRYVSWYKYLIVSLVFSHLGFWSGNLFLIAPFPDLCLLVPFNILLQALYPIPVSKNSRFRQEPRRSGATGPSDPLRDIHVQAYGDWTLSVSITMLQTPLFASFRVYYTRSQTHLPMHTQLNKRHPFVLQQTLIDATIGIWYHPRHFFSNWLIKFSSKILNKETINILAPALVISLLLYFEKVSDMI